MQSHWLRFLSLSSSHYDFLPSLYTPAMSVNSFLSFQQLVLHLSQWDALSIHGFVRGSPLLCSTKLASCTLTDFIYWTYWVYVCPPHAFTVGRQAILNESIIGWVFVFEDSWTKLDSNLKLFVALGIGKWACAGSHKTDILFKTVICLQNISLQKYQF